MSLRQIWNRRAFLGSAGTLAGMSVSAKKTFGWTVNQPAAGVPGALTEFGATGNVYEELGVTVPSAAARAFVDHSARAFYLEKGTSSQTLS